jgi:protein phosphatase
MSSSPLISQTTTYRHLWVAGEETAEWPLGTTISDRYLVVAPKLWKDNRPTLSSDIPDELPAAAMPYMRLYSQRLHVPTLCGFYQPDETASPLLLFDNIPVKESGELYPAIATCWESVPALRQAYWLWQMLQLWTPLCEYGVASSLLEPDNIRVQGWRVRLCELLQDDANQAAELSHSDEQLTESALRQRLGMLWLSWLEGMHPDIAQSLEAICQDLQNPDVSWKTIEAQLNLLLLDQAAQIPLRVEIMGGTTTGPQCSHNEDACYPDTVAIASDDDLETALLGDDEVLNPHLAIVCDGIGGHEGGEVASRLAVRSLKVQMKAMLAELADAAAPVEPSLVMEQLAASIRVVNNLIASQNNSQGRAARQRMGTTLVMALQLPQRLPDSAGLVNAHELYVAHVGDSRAYWLTSDDCHLLTVDDDVATREVLMGRSLYREAKKRPDAGALTQALGTRDGELIRPTVQRFILDEEGILLLCSDGLSDHHWVEKSWRVLTRQVMNGQRSLSETVQAWIEIANRRNGRDNTSVVLMQCQLVPSGVGQAIVDQMSDEEAIANGLDPEFEPHPASAFNALSDADDDSSDADDDMAEFAKVFGEEAEEAEEPETVNLAAIALGLAVLIGVAGAAGIFAWKQLAPTSFERTWDRITEQLDQL